MIRYVFADDVRELAKNIVEVLNDHFSHIDLSRIFFVRSTGSRTTAIARIHALPTIWRYVLSLKPMYVIEVVSERFDKLSREDQVKTIIHELLHIPVKFSGGLRPHGKYVNREIVDRLYRLYMSRAKKYE